MHPKTCRRCEETKPSNQFREGKATCRKCEYRLWNNPRAHEMDAMKGWDFLYERVMGRGKQ